MFVSATTMKNADTLIKLLKIDVNDKALYKSGDCTDVGMAAKIHVSNYKKAPGFKNSVLINFWNGVHAGLSQLTSHMLLKSPLKYPLVRYAASMNPSVIVLRNKIELSKLRFSKILEKLVSLDRITVKEAEAAKEQYGKFIEEIVPSNEEKFQSFTKFDDRLTTFYSQFLMEKEFESSWKVFIIVFCLSHSQSSIERGFKTNDDFIVENQSEFSLMALRKFKITC